MTKKTNFKRHLLASASVLAVGAFASHGALAAQLNLSTVLTGGTNADGYLNNASQTIASGTVSGTGTSTGIVVENQGNNILTIAAGATLTSLTGNFDVFKQTTADSTSSGIVNSGTITQAGSAASFAVNATLSMGHIVNAISAAKIENTASNLNTINLATGKTIGVISNAGSILSNGSGTAILAAGTSTFTSGILNTGTIGITGTGTGNTIDLSANTSTFTSGGISNIGGVISSGSSATTGGTGAAIKVGALTSSATGTTNTVATSAATTSAANGVIYNTGTIVSTGGTGAITVGGSVTNTGAGSSFSLSSNTGTGAGIYNAGTITDTSTGVAILLNAANTTNIYNVGLIGNSTATASTGISVATGNSSGSVLNAGTMKTTTGSNLLVTAVTLTGFKNTGTMTSTASTNGNIRFSASASSIVTTLTNTGTIQDTGDGSAVVWAGAGGATTLNNTAGLITSAATTSTLGTIKTSGSSVGSVISNTGTISATGASGKAIYLANGGVLGAATISSNVISALTTGIINTGTISGNSTTAGTAAGLTVTGTSTGTAIDASADATASALNISNTGTINGDIKTGSGGTSAITLNSTNTLSGTTITGSQLNGNIVVGTTTDAINFNQGAGANQAYAGSITGDDTVGVNTTTGQKGALVAVTGNTTMINTGTTAATTAQVKVSSVTVNSGATLYFKGAVPTSTLSTALTTTSTSGVTTNNGTLQLGARTTHTSTGAYTGNGTLTVDVTNISNAVDGTGTLAGKIVLGTNGNQFNGGASTLVNGVSTGTGGSNGAIAINFTNTSGTYQRATAGGVAGATSGLVATSTAAADLTIATYTANATAITYANGSLNTSSGSSSAIGTSVANGYVLGDNSYVLKFVGYVSKGTTAATNTTDSTDLRVAIIRENTYQTAASQINEKAVGAALEAIGTAGTGSSTVQTIQATLDGYSNASQINSALKTLDATTQTSGATTQATVASQDAAIGTVESRMEVARNETSGTGVATGGKMNNNGVWGEVFGSAIDQAWRKGVDGYQANLGGFAIGADTGINSQTRVGAAFAYGRTEAEGTRQKVNVDSFQGSIYGTYDMGKIYYEGLGAFTFNSYDSTRTLYDNSVASGSFDGQQYSAKATAGYKVDLQGGLKVTPFVSAQYTFLTQDDYSETGSNAPLHISTDDINIFKTGLGTKLAYPIVDGGVTYTPRLSAAWYYDLVGDEVQTDSYFTSAAGTHFVSKGAEVAQSSFKLGAGLDVLAQDNVTVSLDYSWDAKEAYNAHSGALKARFEF